MENVKVGLVKGRHKMPAEQYTRSYAYASAL